MIRLVIDEEWCKGCSLCIQRCPKKVFAKSKKRNPRGYPLPWIATPEDCSACRRCEFICPELAITAEKEKAE